jgi:hypothetical protein
MSLKIHRLVQGAADLQGVGSGNTVEKEMPRLANPIRGPSSGRAAEVEMMMTAARSGSFDAARCTCAVKQRA